MSFTYLKELPTPAYIKEDFPLSDASAAVKAARDAAIGAVLRGESDKFLVIVGPCSADSEEPVMEFIHRLARVNEQTKDRLILIPRIYTNKPRTTGEGYKGIATQPDPEAQPDLEAGLVAVRHLHLRAIDETGLSAADEMLYPENWDYLDDLLSYVAIGARSVEDQQHRMTASGFDVACGMKNPTSGDFSVMLNSVYAAQHSHRFSHRGWEVETGGNPLTHVVLRGAVDKNGASIPNYHYEDLMRLYEMYAGRDLVNPACIVDANHYNSDKHYAEQIRIVDEVLHKRSISTDIRGLVKGVMVESYLEPGRQEIGEHIYGKSITDPCLGWEDTEALLYNIAERV